MDGANREKRIVIGATPKRGGQVCLPNTFPMSRVLAASMLVGLIAPDVQGQSGSPYCAGDGSGGACPCASPGNPGEGCANTGGSGGATLVGSGNALLFADTFQLGIVGVPGAKPGLLLRGAIQANGGLGIPAGDGLLCVTGQSLRSQVQITSAGATTFTDFQGSPFGDSSFGPGNQTNYQFWYRDPSNTCSGSGFNFTNAWTVTWQLGTPAGMALIPAGSFDMGRHVGTGDTDELPVHNVTLSAFYMDILEVTNEKYASYLNSALAQAQINVSSGVVYQNGAGGYALCDTVASSALTRITWDGSSFGVLPGTGDHPLVKVTWHGACMYANERSRQEGLIPCYDEGVWSCDFGATGYRLPTEAEWEYAARGGAQAPYQAFPWGDTINGSHANYAGSGDPFDLAAEPETTPVRYYDGTQVPTGVDMVNGYGLYDMSGNVWEWCWDWYDNNYYLNSPTHNPTGPAPATYSLVRGGSWFVDALSLRCANRAFTYPVLRYHFIGFRVVRRVAIS